MIFHWIVVECRGLGDDIGGWVVTLGFDFPANLAAARVGADWAWANLYRDLAPSVLRYLRAHAVERPDDLLEEVFLETVHKLPSFSGREDDFRAWVFTLAHQRLDEEQRRRGEEPHLASDDSDLGAVVESEEKCIQALSGIGEAHVCAIIGRLTPDQLEVLFLRIIAGLSIEQTAQALGKTPSSIRALQIRGFQSIGRQLPLEAVRR